MEQRDLLGLMRPLKKGWLLIVSMVLIAVFIAHTIYIYQLPVYESQCLIKLDDTYSGFSDNNLYQDLDIFAENNDIATEVEVLKSDTILKKAVDKLDPIEYHRVGSLIKQDIYKDHPFSLRYDSLSFRDYDQLFYVDVLDAKSFRLEREGKFLSGNFGQTLVFEGNEMTLELSEDWVKEHSSIHLHGRYSFRLCSPEYLLQNFVKGNLLVKEVKEHVRVIRIYFEGRNAERVADFTNAIASSYLEDHIAHKMTAANLTEDFLDNRIRESLDKLNRAERALESFRLNNKVLNLGQETETDLRKIAQLEIQETNLNMKLVVLDSLSKYVQLDLEKFLQLAPSYESYGGLLFTELVKQLKNLEEEKIELERKYAKGSDELLSVDQKIRNLVSYIKENIHNHRKNSYAQLDKIGKDINGEKKALESIPTVEKNLKRLERDFNNYQELYNFLTKKQLEAGIAKRAKLYFHRILSRAKIAAAPINPGKWFLSLLAIFIALLLSVFVLYLYDFLSGKIWEVELLKENLSPSTFILEESRSKKLKEDFGLKLISQLKRQDKSSTFLAFCPSNPLIQYAKQLEQSLEALSLSGEKILSLHWEEGNVGPESAKSSLIRSYLDAEIDSDKLKSSLNTQETLYEQMDIRSDLSRLLDENFNKRFKSLDKYFDRIVLVLPAPEEASLVEMLEPLYDRLFIVFQKGVSRKKELAYFSDSTPDLLAKKAAILLDERRQTIFSFSSWIKKQRPLVRKWNLQKSLSA